MGDLGGYHRAGGVQQTDGPAVETHRAQVIGFTIGVRIEELLAVNRPQPGVAEVLSLPVARCW